MTNAYTPATIFSDAVHDLEYALARHASEAVLPISCTDAARTYGYVRDAHLRLAYLLAGSHSALGVEERRLLTLTPSALLAEAIHRSLPRRS